MRNAEPVSPTREVQRRLVAHKCTTNNDSLSTTQVRPYFYVTDYLGSVRMVCDGMTGEVRQSLEYLPSGEIFRAENYPEQSYMFCGKELMTMHGWNMYDSNARFQHSRQPRFSSLDPLAEKYYNLSPYNYAGNDFVNLVDYGGDSIVMRTPDSNGEYHNYTFDLQRFGFYDSNGNALYNDASRKVLRAFSELMKGKRGTRLVSDLSSMEECVLIEVAVGESKNIEADWTSDGFHSAVRWFPEAETLDGLPSFISLAHELAHSEDRLNGTLDSSTWFITESNNGISKRVPKAEIYSTFVENQIRAEHNIPLRTHYACDANGRWIGGQVIRNNASLYFDKSGNHRPNYSKIKKTNRYVF